MAKYRLGWRAFVPLQGGTGHALVPSAMRRTATRWVPCGALWGTIGVIGALYLLDIPMFNKYIPYYGRKFTEPKKEA